MNHGLKEVIISITKRCNSHCRMCEIPVSGAPELSTDEVRKFIGEVALFHPRSLVFSGGEPLLRSDIFDLIALGRRHGLITCLTTNGKLIDRKTAGRLKEAGLSVANVSIDGPCDTHDYLRGDGAFDSAVAAMRNLYDAGVEATIASLVCRLNYSSMPFVMNVARDLKATTVKFQAFSDIFLRDKSRSAEFLLSVDEIQRVRESVEETIALARLFNIATNPVKYLQLLPLYLCGQLGPLGRRGCSSLLTSCPVDSSGNVFPCWAFEGQIIGNIRRTSILDIWNSRRHQELRSKIEKNGCPVCFMSCYDEHFNEGAAKPAIKERFSCVKKTGLLFLFRRRCLGIMRAFPRKIPALRKRHLLERKGDEAGCEDDRRQVPSGPIESELAAVRAYRDFLEKKAQSF